MEAIQFRVNDEQLAYAKALVEHSLAAHKVSNVWDRQGGDKVGHTADYRLTGTLGEVVFADAYGLPRPARSFGAIDGQDNGCDFVVGGQRVDIKTMRRRSTTLYQNYVFNLAQCQLDKPQSVTNWYFFINLSQDSGGNFVAQFVGKITPFGARQVGSIKPFGQMAVRSDGSGFVVGETILMVAIKDMQPIKPPKGIEYTTNKINE